MTRFLFPAVVVAVLSVSPAYAQKKAEIISDNPYLPKIEKTTRELGERLSPDAQKHLYFIREGFGATRAVELVRRDINAAVRACGKANPDMKSGLDDKFSAWAKQVDPVIKENDMLVDRAIKGQDYAKPKEIRDYLDLMKKAAEHANKLIEKDIITTPEACASLEKSMDRTREKVASLLTDLEFLIWPLPESHRVKPPKAVGKTPN